MAAQFEITGVTRTIDLTPGANTGYQYEIAFKTIPHGATGAVLIPERAYTAEEANAAVAPIAAQLERTFDL